MTDEACVQLSISPIDSTQEGSQAWLSLTADFDGGQSKPRRSRPTRHRVQKGRPHLPVLTTKFVVDLAVVEPLVMSIDTRHTSGYAMDEVEAVKARLKRWQIANQWSFSPVIS